MLPRYVLRQLLARYNLFRGQFVTIFNQKLANFREKKFQDAPPNIERSERQMKQTKAVTFLAIYTRQFPYKLLIIYSDVSRNSVLNWCRFVKIVQKCQNGGGFFKMLKKCQNSPDIFCQNGAGSEKIR